MTDMYATTINNDDLARSMRAVLAQASGRPVSVSPLQGASEDFSFYAQATPGLFVFLGITPRNQDPSTAAPNHSPNFFVDEPALVVGVQSDVVNGACVSYGDRAGEHRCSMIIFS